MTSDIALSSAQRDSLLSLHRTDKLSQRTQRRLTTGRKINSVTDDAVNFFRAQSLNDRASDFNLRKDGIDQAISAIESALQTIQAVDKLLKQMKGLAETAAAASEEQRIAATRTFRTIGEQIVFQFDDGSYQGLNLLNNSAAELTVRFGILTQSELLIEGRNQLLNITPNGAGGVGANSALQAQSDAVLAGQDGLFGNRQLAGFGNTGASIANIFRQQNATGQVVFAVSAFDVGMQFGTAGGAALSGARGFGGFSQIAARQASAGADVGISNAHVAEVREAAGRIGNTIVINYIDPAINRMRGLAADLGSNVAILQTRLNFTEAYVTGLTVGSDKLTLADINEEGANLVALRTRQRLGIQALAISGQQQEAVLNLLRT